MCKKLDILISKLSPTDKIVKKEPVDVSQTPTCPADKLEEDDALMSDGGGANTLSNTSSICEVESMIDSSTKEETVPCDICCSSEGLEQEDVCLPVSLKVEPLLISTPLPPCQFFAKYLNWKLDGHGVPYDRVDPLEPQWGKVILTIAEHDAKKAEQAARLDMIHREQLECDAATVV